MATGDIHWIDALLLGGVGIGFLIGARDGFVRQLLRLVVLVAAVYGAIHFHAFGRASLADILGADVPMMAGVVVTFLATFVGLSVTIALARRTSLAFLPTWLREPFADLRRLDTLLGAVASGGVTYLWIGVVLLGLDVSLWARTPDVMAGARLGGPCVRTVAAIGTAIPQRDTDELTEALERVQREGIHRAGEAGGSGARGLAQWLRAAVEP